MATIILENLPDELIEQIQKLAQQHDRVSRLQALYQLVDTAKQQNLDDYDKQLRELQLWFDEDSHIPEWMAERYTKVRRETEQNRYALLEKYRQKAREWLNKLDLDLQAIVVDSDSDRQGKKASELINCIHNEKSEYNNGLTEELEARLTAIAQECTTIHERDLESQILLRFRQLPQSRRANVYERMQQYLTDTTEDL